MVRMFCFGEIDWGVAAAWAQAVLSFLGIVVGAYIAAKVAGLPVLSARHQRLAALVGLIDAGVVLLRLAKKYADDYDAGTLGIVDPPSKFDRAIASITAVPLLDVSPGVLISGLIELREDLAFARELVAHYQDTSRSGAATFSSIDRISRSSGSSV